MKSHAESSRASGDEDAARRQRTPTRQRVLTEAMRLFGEQGYAATTVAQIEEAAGLRPGAGGLYRHFASKQTLLERGVQEQLAEGSDLAVFLSDPARFDHLELRERLMTIARAGITRLELERDLNRILLHGLSDFPELLELVRADQMERIQTVLSTWLSRQVNPAPADIDWDALAAVLMGAISHYWVLRDAMGTHPSGVDEGRYISTMVDLVVARLGQA